MSNILSKPEKCFVCNEIVSYPWPKTCEKPRCKEKYPSLRAALWEGHLLRNNIDLYKEKL